MIKFFNEFVNEELEGELTIERQLQRKTAEVRDYISKLNIEKYVKIFGPIIDEWFPHFMELYMYNEYLNVGKMDCTIYIAKKYGSPLLFKNEPTDEQMKSCLELLRKDINKSYGKNGGVDVVECRIFPHQHGKAYPYKNIKSDEGYIVGFDVEIKIV